MGWTRVGRHSYNTRQHKARPVRTPGGKLKQQRVYKTTKGPRCSDCKTPLQGIKHMKSSQYHTLKKRENRLPCLRRFLLCQLCERTHPESFLVGRTEGREEGTGRAIGKIMNP